MRHLKILTLLSGLLLCSGAAGAAQADLTAPQPPPDAGITLTGKPDNDKNLAAAPASDTTKTAKAKADKTTLQKIAPDKTMADKPKADKDNADKNASKDAKSSGQIEVTADKSLEYYQDERIYVARGNARAVRDDTVVDADLLTAHQRDKPATPNPKDKKPAKPPKTPGGQQAGTGASDDGPSGDLDRIIADGHVRITDERERVLGEHAVYDLDRHVAVLTGDNLKYETEKEIVTAKQSLEYWEDRHMAIARGDAVAVGSGRHVEGDMLSAEFRDTPNGDQELYKMMAEGHVTVITADDVARGDRAVYDVNRNIAILTGNVKITRNDGTQLTGDVGEVDFAANQSRLMNDGHGRVRALLASKTTDKGADKTDRKKTGQTTGTDQASDTNPPTSKAAP